MYNKEFCEVYNNFGWNYYPEAFAAQLLRYLKNRNTTVRFCLDIGCGTGILCELLRNEGIEAYGIDLSENMIRIARQRNSDIRYEVADMVSYIPERRFDLVTCTGDAINHILDLNDVGRVFENVYGYLNSGGLFIFDILSGREVGTGEPIDLDYDENTHATFMIRREDADLVRLSVDVERAGENTCEETITERIYAPKQIEELLRRCGFEKIESRFSVCEGEENDSTTIYMIAGKGLE